MITEKMIVRVATALSYEASLDDIRSFLLDEGLNEYQVFLVVKAGETYNIMSQRTYTEGE